MKILILDTYYSKFLKSFRSNNPKLLKASYQKYKEELLNMCFGTSDFYSYNLKRLGHEAEDLIVNDDILQKKWAKEHGLKINGNWLISKLQMLPYIYRFVGKPRWVQEIVLAQIKEYEPDIIYVQDLSILNPDTVRNAKKYCRLLVGQIASPPPPGKYLKNFDLIITSFPHFVEKFRKMGINSEYQKLAFEPRILKNVQKQKRIYDITFVGSFTPYHSEGTKMLEDVARQMPIHVWGPGIEFLSPISPLRKNYHGEAWGLRMYKILAQSKIAINRHISASAKYANNMRLYEATGMGAMLITDDKKNLNNLFDVGKEVVVYKNSEDLVNKINYYFKNSKEREKIAEAGQERTLKYHNYRVRMVELAQILHRYLLHQKSVSHRVYKSFEV
jgi:glycosyltransferase involved in cell wall biosynthesis